MSCVYVLRQGGRDEFRVIRSCDPLVLLIDRLSQKIVEKLEEFSTVETGDGIACETFLHQSLRPNRKPDCWGSESYLLSSAEMAVAVMGARRFVSEFISASNAAERMEKIETDLRLPAIRPSLDDLALYSRLLRVRDAQDHLKVQRAFCESKLKLSIGNASTLEGIATWKGSWRSAIDTLELRRAEPTLFEDLIQRFEKKTYTRYFKLSRPT